MGDQINLTGSQVGAIGDQNVVSGNTFQQLWQQHGSEIDLAQLAEELSRVRAGLQAEAATAEDAAVVGEVAQAEIAARKGDGPGTLERLKTVGAAVLRKAQEIGTTVLADLLKQTLGV